MELRQVLLATRTEIFFLTFFLFRIRNFWHECRVNIALKVFEEKVRVLIGLDHSALTQPTQNCFLLLARQESWFCLILRAP